MISNFFDIWGNDIIAFIVIFLIITILNQNHLIFSILLTIPDVLEFMLIPPIHIPKWIIGLYGLLVLLYGLLILNYDISNYRRYENNHPRYTQRIRFLWHNQHFLILLGIFIRRHCNYPHVF